MSLTGRKKRPLDRKSFKLRDTSLIVIATEGAQTEKQYFEFFEACRVQVKVLPTPGEGSTTTGCSSPKWVLQRLRQYKKEFQIGLTDQLWLVIDTDRWTPHELSDVATKSLQSGINVAVSNPCFELWLFLHHADLSSDLNGCRKISSALADHLNGYNKTKLKKDDFVPHVETACKRAENIDISPNDRWPQTAGTRVYRLVYEILSL